jgi:hypothetical protein
MKFTKGQTYKIVEFEHGLMLISSAAHLKTDGMQLATADMPALVVYLMRYITEREHGKAAREAHHAAIDEARIVDVRPAR